MLVDSEDTQENLAFYVDSDMYPGLFWLSETEVSFKALERGTAIQAIVDVTTKKRRKIKLYQDFETDSIVVLAANKDYLFVSKSNMYYTGRLGLVYGWSA